MCFDVGQELAMRGHCCAPLERRLSADPGRAPKGRSPARYAQRDGKKWTLAYRQYRNLAPAFIHAIQPLSSPCATLAYQEMYSSP
jgi:hypothetical protein